MNVKLLYASLWFIIFFICLIFYAFKFEIGYFSKRMIAVIYPSYTWHENGAIVIARNNDGHFYIDTISNGVPVKFMIDTGATNVALSKQDAKNIGFDLNNLNYSKNYSTANGTSKAASVIIPEMIIGNLTIKDVTASVGQGELDTSLFGMSVISRFTSFNIDKDLLTLRY